MGSQTLKNKDKESLQKQWHHEDNLFLCSPNLNTMSVSQQEKLEHLAINLHTHLLRIPKKNPRTGRAWAFWWLRRLPSCKEGKVAEC